MRELRRVNQPAGPVQPQPPPPKAAKRAPSAKAGKAAPVTPKKNKSDSKTCPFHAKGMCKFGANCKFSHPDGPVHSAPGTPRTTPRGRSKSHPKAKSGSRGSSPARSPSRSPSPKARAATPKRSKNGKILDSKTGQEIPCYFHFMDGKKCEKGSNCDYSHSKETFSAAYKAKYKSGPPKSRSGRRSRSVTPVRKRSPKSKAKGKPKARSPSQ